jgi:hypothetical protein
VCLKLAEAATVKRTSYGFVLSLAGGIVDAVVTLLFIPTFTKVQNSNSTAFSQITPLDVVITAVIGLILATLVIVGAFLIRRPGRETMGGLAVIILSLLGIIYTAGGLGVGLVLGIVGGILGFLKK